ncbi:MAG: glyoxylate/hydroxypyruvate reductase A [Pseudomonadota bacterium]
MTLRIFLNLTPERLGPWHGPLRDALAHAGIVAEILDTPSEAVQRGAQYVVNAPNGPLQDFGTVPGLRAVLNAWAGVEKVVGNPTLTVPLARMVDPGLTEGMVEYVTGHVLRHHLGMDGHILNPTHMWEERNVPLARERPVGILGLGELGTACAQALRALNFPVTGWSRRPRELAGITCHAGADGLSATLAGAQILVLLLPDTPATTNILNATRLAQLPRGAVIINPGRGPLIEDAALLAALDAGQIGHATLDVFRQEPLPAGHPFWAHPKITVTPHIAADTRPITAAGVIVENIRRDQAGEALLHLVDREAGY